MEVNVSIFMMNLACEAKMEALPVRKYVCVNNENTQERTIPEYVWAGGTIPAEAQLITASSNHLLCCLAWCRITVLNAPK